MSKTSRLETIFFGALEAGSPAEREAFLVEACGSDRELRRRVDRMLAAQEGVGEFLEVPAGELAGISPRVEERPGSEIGPYRLLRALGQGGMGIVFAAEQTTPVQRMVALKIIRPGMDTQQVVTRFEAERQTLALMDHPNIAKVFETGATASGRPFFVMELVEGLPISDYCDQHRLTARERLELFLPICQAVQHAHQKGIIHRDIKPSNVLVTQYDGNPVPKVIDFGIAKATRQPLSDETRVTQLGQLVGTLEYMSPEQIEMSPLDIDTRSDIYSLGVLLYELLTGTTPIEKKELYDAGFQAMRLKIHEEDPPRPSQRLSTLNLERQTDVSDKRRSRPRKLESTIRGELDWIVMKALEKERSRRYDTASALAADVGRYLNDEPVEARAPSAWYRFRKIIRRNRATAAAITIVAIALLASSFITARQAVTATRARNQARTMTRIATAVNDFLTNDLLAQADPRNEPDRDLPLRTILDRTSEKIEARFDGEPLVAAALHTTVGKTYRSLGEYGSAERHFQRAIDLSRETVGADHEQTLAAMSEFGKLLLLQGRTEEAERTQRDLLRTRIELLGYADPATLQSINDLGEVCETCGRFDAAERVYLEAHDIFLELPGNRHAETLAVEHRLGRVYRLQGRLKKAADTLQRVAEQRQKHWGREHPDTLETECELATVFLAQRRLSEADALSTEVATVARRVLGSEHPDTLAVLHLQATIHSEMGRHEQAERELRDVRDAFAATLGSGHPDTLAAQNSLAESLRDQSCYEEATRLNLEIIESPHITPPIETAALRSLIRTYEAQGSRTLAERYKQQLEERLELSPFDLEDRLVLPWHSPPFTFEAPPESEDDMTDEFLDRLERYDSP